MVRLAVAAAALGLPDVLMCRATYPLTPDGPFTPGQEVAGTVTALGLGVDRDLMGRRLLGVTAFYLGHGGLAEEALAPAATLFPVPDDMADADAAAFYIAFHTAWIGLCRRARLQADETLLVLGGAGGSGAAAVALGHSLGSRVIAVVGGAGKRRAVLGALRTGIVTDLILPEPAARWIAGDIGDTAKLREFGT